MQNLRRSFWPVCFFLSTAIVFPAVAHPPEASHGRSAAQQPPAIAQSVAAPPAEEAAPTDHVPEAGAAAAESQESVVRVQAERYRLSVALPAGWQSFQGDSKVRGEVLFLQSPEQAVPEATVRLSAFAPPRSWESLLRRETYHLVVETNAPVLVDEALTLRGAKGHKWVYRAVSSSGQEQLHYRLYLALPATVGANRLLVMHATAPAEQTAEAMALFNSLARSLAWGPATQP